MKQREQFVVFQTVRHFCSAAQKQWSAVLVTVAEPWNEDLERAASGLSKIVIVALAGADNWPRKIARMSEARSLSEWLDTRESVRADQASLARSSEHAIATRADIIHGVPYSPVSSRIERVPRFYAPPRCQLLAVARVREHPALPQATRPKTRAPAQAASASPAADSMGRTLSHVEELLRRQGRPMTRTELIAALGANAQSVFYAMLGQRPFVELSSQVWGLIDRDVPGGNKAFDAALLLLHPSWARRSAVTEEAVEAVRELSAQHRSWSRDTIVSAIRCARRHG